MHIPFLSFQYSNEAIKQKIITQFESFFDSGNYILGKKVKRFEEDYARYNKVNIA